MNTSVSASPPNDRVVTQGTRGLAREYRDSDIDRNFRVNGLDTPSDATYSSLVRDSFRGYRLIVDGLVERPQKLALAEFEGLPAHARTARMRAEQT